MIYARTLALMQKELHVRYQVSSTIRHRGEKGRNREHGLAMFLRENLPEKYGVATGEIIPFKGDMPSPQCDIIIYDRLSFPIIGKSSAVQQVPYEAVYSVIEVKSQITSGALRDALEKFSSIRQMPRCQLRRKPKRAKDRDPFFVLFGYELATSTEKCLDFTKQGVDGDIMLIALDTGLTIWLGSSKERRPLFLTATVTEKSVYWTLTYSFATIINGLSSMDLGTPNFLSLTTQYE